MLDILGRSVSLEHWIKGTDGGAGSSASGSSTRVMTHMISCRGSDIFLHALGVHRCPFEDPPGISDGVGGKVTDYRINVSRCFCLGDEVLCGFLLLDSSKISFWTTTYFLR